MSLLFLLFLLDTTYLDCVEKKCLFYFFTMFDDFSKYDHNKCTANLENNQIWEDPTNIEFVFFCQHRVYSILCQNSILEIN